MASLMPVVIFGGLLAFQCVLMGLFLMKELPGMDRELRELLGPLSRSWLFAIVSFAPMMLEIRENGIAYGGLRFLPWRAVTGYHWMDGKHGVRLTISSAKGKHVTVISPGDRDPVQRLLDAKQVSP